MEIFKNKFLVKLIASICLFFTLFNFSGINKVHAGNGDEDLGWGGVLIKPITSLMTAIGDSIMDILHDSIKKQDTSIVKISGDTNWNAFWKTIAVVVVAAVAAVVFVLAAAATGGLAAGLAGAIAGGTFTFSMSVSAGTLIGGVVVGICVGIRAGDAWFPDDIYLPVFSISAEEIFANRIPLFDVNFFSPMEAQEVQIGTNQVIKNKKTCSLILAYDVYDLDNEETIETNEKWKEQLTDIELDAITIPEETGLIIEPKRELVIDSPYKYDCIIEDVCINQPPTNTGYFTLNEIFQHLDKNGKATTKQKFSDILLRIENTLKDRGVPIDEDYKDNYGATIHAPTTIATVGPTHNEGRIFFPYNEDEGKCAAIIIMEEIETEITQSPVMGTLTSTAEQLKSAISTWYFIIRNIALIVLMLLLIYSGIRIVIGSTAGEKAKYKERIMDWLVAICLVMIMHYIMVFAVELVGQITQLINSATTKNTNAAYIPLSTNQWNNASELDWTEFGGQDSLFVDDSTAESGKALVWQTDLVGLFRIQAQFENEGTAKWVGYSFCYVVLVLLTLFFAFTYIKRILYMAFLTIIAPLVAMTYPIDKITDGKAQAFNSWLKEYIFNLMIQPLHLLLYIILVTSAFYLATNNPVYALVSLGFIMPAEKLMRRFFGFEKAKTPGLLGGAAGAAIAMSGLQGLLKHKPQGGKADGGKGKSADENKVRFSNKNKGNAMDDITGITAVPKGNLGNNAVVQVPNQSIPQRRQQASSSSQTQTAAITNPAGGYDISQETEDNAIQTAGAIYDTETPNMEMSNPEDSKSDDIDMLFDSTTLGMDDWEHDGFGSDNLGHMPQMSGKINISGTLSQVNTDEQEYEEGVEEPAPKQHKRSIMRAIGVATLGIGKQAAVGVLTGLHPIRFAGKVAAGVTAATAGLLVGTASGDPSKAFQYTTAGAMAGSALADSLSGRRGLDTETIKQEVEMAYYGPDYKEKVVERQKEEFKTSTENINYLRQVMGVSHAEAKQILETTGDECYENGITDIKDVATIHQLTHPKDKKDKMSFRKAAAARTYAKRRLGGVDADQMTDDKVREYQARWSKEFRERYKINKTQADDLAKKSFDAAIRFNKAYSGLTKVSKE